MPPFVAFSRPWCRRFSQVVDGFREATVLGEVAAWESRDACRTAPAASSAPGMTTQTWTCSSGTKVELATYAGGDHGWPAGGDGTPTPGQVIWAFLQG